MELESIDVSSEGKSAGPVKECEDGGVRALWSGEALYDWLLCDMLVKGGMEERLIEEGDCGICCKVSRRKREKCFHRPNGLTGVISRSESASVAEVAASIRSSHLLPIAAAAAAPGGSAENAFLPSMLNLLE